jgi:hypothetical protein
MDQSRALSSWLAVRPVAVLLTVGMMSVGVSACGSSSKSSTTVGKKHAAQIFTKDISLRIVNRGLDSTIHVYFCGDFDNPCNGKSVYHICHLEDRQICHRVFQISPSGRILLANGQFLTFGARNPLTGRPQMALFDPTDIVPLVEGEIQTRHRNGYKIVLSREADTSVKNMTLEVFSP